MTDSEQHNPDRLDRLEHLGQEAAEHDAKAAGHRRRAREYALRGRDAAAAHEAISARVHADIAALARREAAELRRSQAAET